MRLIAMNRWACACVLLILAPGCALLGGGKPKPLEPAPAVAPAAAAGDTLPAALPPRPTQTARTPAAPPAAPAADPAETEEQEEPAQPIQITIRLSEEERTRLQAETAEDLSRASRSLALVDRGRLSDEEAQRVTAADEMLAAAQDAMAKGDLQAAARLARKARLLAEEAAGK